MGSGSSVSAPPAPETRQLQTNMSVTSGYLLSEPELQPADNHILRTTPDSKLFTPDESRDELGSCGARTSLPSRLETNVRSAVAISLSERPPLSEDQESKISTCLTSLEKHLQDLQLRFDRSNILLHTRVVQLEGGEGIEILDHVGEGLFVVDSGTVDLLSSGTDTADNLPVIRLTEGDYCGEYSTIFNISFRIRAQFNTSVILLHLPAEIVRVNMHYTGQLDREAMLKLSVIQSNLLSGECFGEDISSRVVAMCLKASPFSSFGEDALGCLADTVVPLLFTTADVVYNEGEIATYVFLVLRGVVQLVQRGQVHTTHKVNCSSEGVSLATKEFFGGTVLSHQARASGPLLLGAIGREQILDMLDKFPECAAAVRRVVQSQ